VHPHHPSLPGAEVTAAPRRLRFTRLLVGLTLAVLPGGISGAWSQTFDFSSIATVDEMRDFLTHHFPVGSDRAGLRQAFVTEGKATLVPYPGRTDVEKYIYDINLCRLYVWRWNISADYDASGRLVEVFVNGNAVFKPGHSSATRAAADKPGGEHAKIYKMQRPRPEADKGESYLGFILRDVDGNPDTIADQKIVGAGPSRADPVDMGVMIAYGDIEQWRSIFDFDAAKFIAPYAGACK
jgi:hypothetical protein